MPASDSIAYKFRPGLQAATLDDKKVPTDHTASIFGGTGALYFNSISGFNDPFESKFICPEKPENDAHAFRSILNRIISAIGGSAAEVNLFLANPLARWFMFELASRDCEQASIIIELKKNLCTATTCIRSAPFASIKALMTFLAGRTTPIITRGLLLALM